MPGVLSFYGSSVGKKVTMAVSGITLILFVVVHMIGNLKIYLGADHFNEYAHFLREAGVPALPHEGLLWIARVVLLGLVGIHIISAVQVWLMSRSARETDYKKGHSLSFSYASRTMRWGGVILLVFIVFHILHLTLGTCHPAFDAANPYGNVVIGFQSWLASGIYLVAQVFLGLHVYHGLWSACQTLNINNPRISALRRPVSLVVSLAVVIGNCSIPLAVLLGFVR